jgi:DNA-3-methyladenine glycosylase I
VADLVIGADGLARCAWGTSAPEYLAYHDTEWGVPIREDNALYERLTLEAFQSGLSWLTILRKREGFRRAFAGFDISKVAVFGEADIARLLADTAIVRNRAKVEAAIANARAAADLPDGLAALLWTYAPPARRARPESFADLPRPRPSRQPWPRT